MNKTKNLDPASAQMFCGRISAEKYTPLYFLSEFINFTFEYTKIINWISWSHKYANFIELILISIDQKLSGKPFPNFFAA